MSDVPHERPRTWFPLVAAGVIGVIVIVGAVVTFALGGGPDESEAAVIAACEAEYAESAGPAIVAGEIYDPTQWRDHYSIVEANADVATPLDDLPAEVSDAWQTRADVYEDTGIGSMVIVWRLEDDSYAQCTVPVADGTVDPDGAVTGPLEIEALESVE